MMADNLSEFVMFPYKRDCGKVELYIKIVFLTHFLWPKVELRRIFKV